MEIFISFVLNERVKRKSFLGYPLISLSEWEDAVYERNALMLLKEQKLTNRCDEL